MVSPFPRVRRHRRQGGQAVASAARGASREKTRLPRQPGTDLLQGRTPDGPAGRQENETKPRGLRAPADKGPGQTPPGSADPVKTGESRHGSRPVRLFGLLYTVGGKFQVRGEKIGSGRKKDGRKPEKAPGAVRRLGAEGCEGEEREEGGEEGGRREKGEEGEGEEPEEREGPKGRIPMERERGGSAGPDA